MEISELGGCEDVEVLEWVEWGRQGLHTGTWGETGGHGMGIRGWGSGDMRMFGLGKWRCQSSREGDMKGWGGDMGLVKPERTRSRAWGHVVTRVVVWEWGQGWKHRSRGVGTGLMPVQVPTCL